MRNFFGSTFKIHLISDHFNHATIISHLEMASASWVVLMPWTYFNLGSKLLIGLRILILHSLTYMDVVLEHFLFPVILGQCFCILVGSSYRRSPLWPTQNSKAAAATLSLTLLSFHSTYHLIYVYSFIDCLSSSSNVSSLFYSLMYHKEFFFYSLM